MVYMTFQYLTVSCIPAIGHGIYDISIPDSFMYTCYWSCIRHFSTRQFCVYLLLVMYKTFQCQTVLCIPAMTFQYLTVLCIPAMTFQYLTVLCIPATGHVYDISIPIVGMGGIITDDWWPFGELAHYASEHFNYTENTHWLKMFLLSVEMLWRHLPVVRRNW